MALDPPSLYRAHVQNIRSVRTAIEHVERDLKFAIARQNDVSADALLKLLLLLVGSWAECRLRKLAYEPNGFSEVERTEIQAQPSQIDRWNKAVEFGFRKRYKVTAHVLKPALPFTPRARFTTIVASLQEDLKPLIEMRNSLAHGQWERPLTNDELNINQDMCQNLALENCLSAGFKLKILEVLSSAIHDLIAGNHAFERDFDRHFSILEQTRRNLATRNYEDWKGHMIDKYRRGLELRAENFRSAERASLLKTIWAALGI